MSRFCAKFDAMNAISQDRPARARGENGTTEFTTAGMAENEGGPRVALFFALTRNLPDERLASLFADCVGEGKAAWSAHDRHGSAAIFADLFVLAFQSRDCRGGKGERKLFYGLLLQLYSLYPATVIALLKLVPEFGYFKDYFSLVEYLEENKSSIPRAGKLRRKIMEEVAKQLQDDEAKLDASGTASVSLCAKYCPREGKHFYSAHRQSFDMLLEQLYPDLPVSIGKVVYRKLLARLTSVLDVTEVKMCGKRFAEIDMEKVPSLCVKKYRKAFLNESLEGGMKPAQYETGNRHPYDVDRVACRQHLMSNIKSGKVKGKQLYPHEIVRELMKTPVCVRPGARRAGRGAGRGGRGGRGDQCPLSSLEIRMLEVQWNDMRNNLVASLRAKKEAGAVPAIDLGKLVPLVDVSGSMAGEPMEVAIALGILVSEMNHPAFSHRLLTFENSPKWVHLSASMSLNEKVQKTKTAPWGGSTNLAAAMRRIADVIETNRLTMDEVPDLIIFSDMQFDQSTGNGHHAQTQLEQIQKLFADIGRKVCGKPYPAPRIIFWNLRGNTAGFPAKANAQNVQMLSGYSPSLFRFVTEGVVKVEEEEAQGEMDVERVVKQKAQVDPYMTLRKVLDDVRYDAVRQVIVDVAEGVFSNYLWAPVAVPTETAASMDASDTV